MTSLDTTALVAHQQRVDAPPAVRFSLEAGESTGSGLHRILVEQVELGAWHLERAQLSDTHVHEVRKATKRVRAVLRMLSDDIDSRDYVRLNAEVRDLSRELSQVRSAVVQVEMLGSLVAEDAQLIVDTRGLHRELVAALDTQRQGLEDSEVEDLSSRFMAVRSGIEEIELHDDATTSLGGVRRTYRRGRKSMTHAYAAPTIESFHTWRKQVKYLRHQMEILQSVGTPAIPELVADLEEIGEALGGDHDLADLERAANTVAVGTLSSSTRQRLKEVIATRRSGLELRLKPIATRVYAANPGAFAEQVIPPFA
jgi:CHAD domain-containing protein